MEQLLKKFFNDNSVCVGLCDMKRKSADFGFSKPVQTFTQAAAFQTAYEQNFTVPEQIVYAQQAYETPVYEIREVKNIFKKPETFAQKPIFTASEQKPVQEKTFELKKEVKIEKKPVELKQVQQKPQKQSLAQRFAAQQKEYAAQQAFMAEQRKRYAEQQLAAQKSFLEQTKAAQQLQAIKEAQKAQFIEELTKKQENNTICTVQRGFVVDGKSYIEYGPQKVQEPKTIVNGNMKKVVSAAVPARYL